MPQPSKSETTPLRICALVFILALLARLLFLLWRGAELGTDSAEYFTLAHNLVAHHSFSLEKTAPFIPSIRRAPVYPALLAGLEWFGLASPSMIVVVHAALDSAVATMVLLLARAIVSAKWALLAAVFYALHPGAIYTANFVLSDAPFTFLLVTALSALIYGLGRDRMAATAGGGVLLGLAILCRPIALPLPLILFAFLFLRRKFSRQRKHALLFLLGSIVAVAPWSLRTSLAAGQLVLVQSGSAVNYWAPTVLSVDQRDETRLWNYEAELLKQRWPNGHPAGPQQSLENDRFLRHEAISNIDANPRVYLISRVRAFPYLFLTSFDYFSGFNTSFATLWAQRDFFKLAVKVFLLLAFSAVPFLLGIIGVLLAGRSFYSLLFAVLWLYTLVVHLPLWIEYRFWLPVIPFLIANAASGASILVTRLRAG